MSAESRRPEDARMDAASRLLGRPPPESYLEAWRRTLKHRLESEQRSGRFSVGLFRLGEELFALPTANVVEVHPSAPVRSMPGRTGEIFRGLVSLRGEIHLCASLHALFGVENDVGAPEEHRRLLVVQRAGQTWALIVDEVLDFERFDAQQLKGAQATVSKSAVHFTDGVVDTPAGPAARIDPQRLFEGLARSVQ